ncbi:MAG TPA: Z1 domain-containing protein [Caulobacteraceae bacterium]
MSASRTEQEKNFISSLISGLANRSDPPTRAEVEAKAKQLAAVFDYEGALNNIIEEVLIAIDTRMGAGVSLVDHEADHDDEWVYKREIAWTYSDAYEEFLKKEKWHPTVVRSLSDVGTKILGHLQDPTSEGSWNRRGLVIGHVQSGKTANYTGLIAKAADAGYKFIIVSAGIHSNLRKQTQERIDEAFIGRSSDPDSRVIIGVGLSGNYPHPATLTNINDDFNKTTAAKSGWKINDFSKPIIIVIKKNVRTLESLFKWLKELNAQGDGRIGDVPMLFIDDEADNASINTNKPDINPTRTNAMIRRVLGLFTKSCYVGYTATPFANIFINPDAYDDEVREELFPRHFIYSLDPPNTYFGPNKVFLDDATSSKILETIRDCENYIPTSHKKGDPVHELPPSLYGALNEFIVARAIRNLRGQAGKHCSMLINVSRFVDTQRVVRDFISERQKKIFVAVKANYAKPPPATETNEHIRALKTAYDTQYADCGFSWAEVRKALFSAFDHLRIYVVNSKSDEQLDYKKYEKEGAGLTAIAVGGLSLSRGLTLEGLTVSYMYRNTRMYDTLLQMGRWFGYRPNFEDLCRVHLSRDSINWYGHISEATEELREQIKRMRRANMTPEQFGLYVQSHPDSLMVTAANKMRTGQKITVSQNLTGKLMETWKVPISVELNRENEKLISTYWRGGFGKTVEPTPKGWVVHDADQEVIQDFIGSFKVHKDFGPIKGLIMSYLDQIKDVHPVADVLLISGDKGGEDEMQFTLGAQERVASKKGVRDGGWILNKYRVASRGDEKLGLTPQQIALAVENAAADAANESKGKAASDYHYRVVRKKPLLMIHVLAPTGNSDVTGRIPAFGVSFPDGLFGRTVEVVANKRWVEQTYGPMDDDPDDEDDYDE